MKNSFIRHKAASRMASPRALRRQATPSAKQQRRIIRHLKADADKQIRKSLEQRQADESEAADAPESTLLD